MVFACEKPLCASVATALVTSEIARFCELSLVRSSVSEITSVSPTRLRRDQSMTAMRVLSPGARLMEWNSCPSVTHCADQDWLNVSSAPNATVWKP